MSYNIKNRREELGLTQAELAERSGVTRATIIALESDRPYVTTTKTLLNVAKALGTTVEAIFFEESV